MPFKRSFAITAIWLFMVGLLTLWAYIARWTTLQCRPEICVYMERRLLTLPWERRVPLDRIELVAHPERLRVQLYDSQHHGADLVVESADGELRVDEGSEVAMKVRAADLRERLADFTSAIDESVSPHPFGLLALGMLGLVLLTGALSRFKRAIRRSG